MENENRNCENCGRKMPRASFIPFNNGMIVCQACFDEWERLGSPGTMGEYLKAIATREEYQSNLIAKK